MPNHPIAKNVLNMNRNAEATIPVEVPGKAFIMARTDMDRDIPAAPNNMRLRRPYFSIV
jgi:hypothetical protein